MEKRVVVIEGEEFPLNPEIMKVMKYFEQSEAIEQTYRHEINILSKNNWLKIIEMLQAVNYKIPVPPPTITSNDPRTAINSTFTKFLQQLSYEELNELYKTLGYLKAHTLKRCIAAFLACRIFTPMNALSYKEKKKELNIQKDLTSEDVTIYQQRFPFLN